MSQKTKAAPAATTPTKKAPTKLTLSQQGIDDDIALQKYIHEPSKHQSAKTLISQGQKEVFDEAKAMTQAQVDEEVKKAKRVKGDADSIEIPPSQYKYKLDASNQKKFFTGLSADELKVIPSDIKANLDILVNKIPTPPTRPSAGYFLFSQDLREKAKASGEAMGSIADFSAKIKAEWDKLGSKGQGKYTAKYDKAAAEYKANQATYKELLAVQAKAVAFYQSKLKLDVQSPQDIAKAEKEALENHGVKWRAHFAESLMKRIIAAVPGLPDGKVSSEFARTLAAAAEAYVVYLGQQTGLRTIRMGKKTVSPVVLKATTGELPQGPVLGHFPSFVNLQIDEKTLNAVRNVKNPKAKKVAAADADAKQPKLKLVPTTKKGSNFDMNDDDDVLDVTPAQKPTAGKKATKTTKAAAAAAEKPAESKKDTALKTLIEKSNAKAKADPAAAAKAAKMDDDDLPATPAKAKKTTAKKSDESDVPKSAQKRKAAQSVESDDEIKADAQKKQKKGDKKDDKEVTLKKSTKK